MQEAGADGRIASSCLYTLDGRLEYVARPESTAGEAIETFAPTAVVLLGSGMNFFMEVAKLRAAAKAVAGNRQGRRAEVGQVACLRAHCKTVRLGRLTRARNIQHYSCDTQIEDDGGQRRGHVRQSLSQQRAR